MRNIATLVNPAALFYETPLELDSIETSSSHRPLYVLLEGSSIIYKGGIQHGVETSFDDEDYNDLRVRSLESLKYYYSNL